MWTLRNIVSSTVRKTDVATRLSRNQFIIILTDMNNEYVDIATNRITEAWNNDDNNNEFELTFESQEINSEIQGDM
jgi:GGDEF domain-containing protein